MDELEEKLRYAFSLANEWLRFAEAKNAGLFAFNGALVAGLIEYSSSVDAGVKFCLLAGIIFFGASMAVNLASFLPCLAQKTLNEKTDVTPSDNPFFFKHCAFYSLNAYLNLMERRLVVPVQRNDVHTDLAKQIVSNSYIAVKKYEFFHLAARISFFAILASILFISSTLYF